MSTDMGMGMCHGKRTLTTITPIPHGEDGVCSTCGHAHMPTPAQVDSAGDWRTALGIILSIGMRPCTGAVLVLVFARVAQIPWTGVSGRFRHVSGHGHHGVRRWRFCPFTRAGLHFGCSAITAVRPRGAALRWPCSAVASYC